MTDRTPRSVLEVQGLYAGYGPTTVVRNLDLHVNAGEVVALLGPNGAGKTTTLLTAAGLLPSQAGTVTVLGRSCDSRRPWRGARRGVALVAEERAVFFDLTVRENLQLGIRGSRKQGLAATFGYFPALAHLLDRQAGLLSGGEQQMLALARALVGQPKVLMVDEMSLGLAPVIVQRLLPILRRVADEQQVGVLLVEQHVHMALAVADRSYVLKHGELVMSGAAKELSKRSDLLAAEYLGGAAL